MKTNTAPSWKCEACYGEWAKGGCSSEAFRVRKLVDSGRFLEKDTNSWWQEVSDLDAKRKIAKLLVTTGTKMNWIQQHGVLLARAHHNEDDDHVDERTRS
jgi:hypothetical protein